MQAVHRFVFLVLAIGAMSFSTPAFADGEGYVVDGMRFDSRSQYLNSDYFRDMGRRCGTPSLEDIQLPVGGDLLQSDCTLSSTTVNPAYNPGDTFEIPVVVHVISRTNGVGNINDAQVQSQIDILNEDYMAITGTPGAPGTMTGIEFRLEAINRVTNDT